MMQVAARMLAVVARMVQVVARVARSRGRCRCSSRWRCPHLGVFKPPGLKKISLSNRLFEVISDLNA